MWSVTTPRMVYRRYRRSRARTYRRYRRSSFNRARRSASMQFAGMVGQRDIARFCLKYRLGRTMTLPSGAFAGTDAISAISVLATVPQYNAIAQLFDEVKINAVRVKVVPLWQKAVDSSSRVMAVYAWDRNGVPAGTTPNFDEVCSYGSSYKSACTSFTKNQYSTSIVATDIAERALYCPTMKLRELNENETSAAKAFNPTFLYGLASQVAAGATGDQYAYEFEFSFDLTFRGTRYENAKFE